MKKSELRVAVARDVLIQLRLNRLEAASGTYVCIDTEDVDPEIVDAAYDTDQSFQEFFKKNKKVKCEACALGSAFISLVNIENKCSVIDMNQHDDMFKRLTRSFCVKNMSLMESAFEGNITNHGMPEEDATYEHLKMAAEWGDTYGDDEKRLRAIMLNIIRNNGDFKVPVKFAKKWKAARKASIANGTW